ncbi:MAG: hypothetical protein GOP50_11855 [Candidatus Heimdallarchaeota archaeon]|nr:hypothetical protein [Candidatus Heimdallarchaeota archaeon]
MKIVVSSPKEKELLIVLLRHLADMDVDFFLDFEDPMSFKLEEIFEELYECHIDVDKSEEPLGLTDY